MLLKHCSELFIKQVLPKFYNPVRPFLLLLLNFLISVTPQRFMIELNWFFSLTIRSHSPRCLLRCCLWHSLEQYLIDWHWQNMRFSTLLQFAQVSIFLFYIFSLIWKTHSDWKNSMIIRSDSHSSESSRLVVESNGFALMIIGELSFLLLYWSTIS